MRGLIKKRQRTEYFEITSLCKDDLRQQFHDHPQADVANAIIDNLSDDQMKKFASKMADIYLDQLYWQSIEEIFSYFVLDKEVINDN